MELTEWEKDGARVRPHGRGDEGCCLHMPGKPGTEGTEAVIRRKRKGYISPVVRTRGTIPPLYFYRSKMKASEVSLGEWLAFRSSCSGYPNCAHGTGNGRRGHNRLFGLPRFLRTVS